MKQSLSFFCNLSTQEITLIDRTLDKILNEACNMMNVTVPDAISKSKKYEMCVARALYINYCRDHSFATLSEIGNVIKRDHSTVIHALKKQNTDHLFKKKYEQFETKLNTTYAPVH